MDEAVYVDMEVHKTQFSVFLHKISLGMRLGEENERSPLPNEGRHLPTF